MTATVKLKKDSIKRKQELYLKQNKKEIIAKTGEGFVLCLVDNVSISLYTFVEKYHSI